MSKTVGILRAARERLSTPSNWCKGGPRCGATCIDLALDDAGDRDSWASEAVRRVLGIENPDLGVAALFRWNDAPERTHADVLDALDRAIAAEGPA